MFNQTLPQKNKFDVISNYDQHFADVGKLRDSDAFYRWVLDKLVPLPESRLLDVACGEGVLLKLALQRGVLANGVDFSSRAVQTAQQMASPHIALVSDGEYLPFRDCCFDFATNLGSLEHFTSPERGLNEMYRVLKPGGKIGLVLPNSYYWLDILWHVWRTGYPVSHKQVIERFATFGEWRDLIEAHGFRTLKAHKYNFCFPRSKEDLRWYARFPKKLVYLIFSPVTPFHLSYSFLFICERNA